MDTSKLGKILALASSPNDGEALNALRMARTALSRAGLDFSDLSVALRKQDDTAALEEELSKLRRENRRLKRQSKAPASAATGVDVAELKRQLTRESLARRRAERARTKAEERVEQLQQLWRRATDRRLAATRELREAQEELATLQRELRKLQRRATRLTGKPSAAMAHAR